MTPTFEDKPSTVQNKLDLKDSPVEDNGTDISSRRAKTCFSSAKFLRWPKNTQTFALTGESGAPATAEWLCFKALITLRRVGKIFPENNGCLERLAPPMARPAPFRKQFMCRRKWEWQQSAQQLPVGMSGRRRRGGGFRGEKLDFSLSDEGWEVHQLIHVQTWQKLQHTGWKLILFSCISTLSVVSSLYFSSLKKRVYLIVRETCSS